MAEAIRIRNALISYLVRFSPVCLYGTALAVIAAVGTFTSSRDAFWGATLYTGYSAAEKHLVGVVLILTIIYGFVRPPVTGLWPTVVYSAQRCVQSYLSAPVLLVYGAWGGLILLALWDVDRARGYPALRRLCRWRAARRGGAGR